MGHHKINGGTQEKMLAQKIGESHRYAGYEAPNELSVTQIWEKGGSINSLVGKILKEEEKMGFDLVVINLSLFIHLKHRKKGTDILVLILKAVSLSRRDSGISNLWRLIQK